MPISPTQYKNTTEQHHHKFIGNAKPHEKGRVYHSKTKHTHDIKTIYNKIVSIENANGNSEISALYHVKRKKRPLSTLILMLAILSQIRTVERGVMTGYRQGNPFKLNDNTQAFHRYTCHATTTHEYGHSALNIHRVAETFESAIGKGLSAMGRVFAEHDPLRFPGADASPRPPQTRNHMHTRKRLPTSPPMQRKQPNPLQRSAQSDTASPLSRNEILMRYYKTYNDRYPDLKKMASSLLKERIKQETNLDINPDKNYFMVFKSGMGNNVDYTGWEHDSQPLEYGTLTRYMFTNFPAEAQENLLGMNSFCGIYSVSPQESNRFSCENEVKILPSRFVKLIWNIDFYNYALNNITKAFENKDDHIRKYFTDFITHLASSSLNEEVRKDVLGAVGLIKHDESVAFPFDINGYPSAEIFLFYNKVNERYSLYIPHHTEKFLTFGSMFMLRMWIVEQCRNDQGRNVIASHFSIYNRQDGVIFQGIDRWLNEINSFHAEYDRIATTQKYINRCCFFDTAFTQRKDKILSDLDSLIKSDAEVRRDMWENYIDASNIIPNPMSLLLSLGIHIEHAIDADTTEEREAEYGKITDDLVNLVLMILIDKAVKIDAGGYEFIDQVKETFNEVQENIGVEDASPNNEIEIEKENVQIECPPVFRRGINISKNCRITITDNETGQQTRSLRQEIRAPIFASGTTGVVYDLGDGTVLKKYTTKIDASHKGNLKKAMNSAKTFNRLYGKNTATISINDHFDGTATVYLKMKKIPGRALIDIDKITDPDELIAFATDLNHGSGIDTLADILQKNGIKHNDINAANILYDAEKKFSIIDFDSVVLLNEGEPVPDTAMLAIKNRIAHVFKETSRFIRSAIDVEALLIDKYGEPELISADIKKTTYRCGKYIIKKFNHEKARVINHEAGACNHFMSAFKIKTPRALVNRNKIILPFIRGTKPGKVEIERFLKTLHKKGIFMANANRWNLIKTANGKIVPVAFELVFSKSNIEKLPFESKKQIVSNYNKGSYRRVPRKIKDEYDKVIKYIERSLDKQSPLLSINGAG